jgi:hypothetical protein
VREWFSYHVDVRSLDEEKALTDSSNSPNRPGERAAAVGPKDGDAMINDAGKHEVKSEGFLALPRDLFTQPVHD